MAAKKKTGNGSSASKKKTETEASARKSSKKIVIEGMEKATVEELRDAADKLDVELSAEDENLQKKRTRARLMRLKIRELSEECGCTHLTRIEGNRRRVILECDECKARYVARGER